MTINDMLEQGVIFQGKIQVDTWNDDGDSIVLFESDGVTEGTALLGRTSFKKSLDGYQ